MYVLDLSDMEFLDDSSTESLLLSGDEYNQDFDSTNFEESQDEDDALNEIVRCICVPFKLHTMCSQHSHSQINSLEYDISTACNSYLIKSLLTHECQETSAHYLF